ncbi:hypothetical protein [Hymenobacter terrenus]|nr:hypothetical protein [Hymenobacter terrenus]
MATKTNVASLDQQRKYDTAFKAEVLCLALEARAHKPRFGS